MIGDPLGTAIRRLLGRVSSSPAQGTSDADLLERFVRHRDEAAIEALLWRHGPMVLSVCRRTTRNEADSEDCFQAVFLVFCRRASTIAKRKSIASWLYKVAYRISLRACAARARQPAQSAILPELPAGKTVTEIEECELRQILDEELNHLPERYRAPLVLRYLEGKTVEQTTQELGWRPGTVSSRLARGKELLRVRLGRHGLILTIAAVTSGLLPAATTAAPFHSLVLKTVQGVFTGKSAQFVTTLAQEVARSQVLRRLKWAFALLVAVGTAAAGTGVILTRDQPEFPDRVERLSRGLDGEVQEPVDLRSDPLPRGAIRRLGSARFRHGGSVH